MTQPSETKLPIIRLKPKANARALRRGFPWVYDNELVTDRRTKALVPGTIAILEDSERTQMGLVGVTPGSRLIARMLDRDVAATIDAAWLYAKLKYALELRETLFEAPFYRLIHAEADGLPGVIIDRFGGTFVIQPNAAWADALIEPMCAALVDLTGADCVIKNSGGRGRALEGLDDVDVVLHGTPPSEPIPVAMNGAIYMADVMGGQKTGLFYDQRPNHAFVAGLSKGKSVLDVFSHVGGFGLASLGAGAASALCVDGSAPALALAEQSAAKMDMSGTFSVLKADAFDALTELGAEGSSFDVVVCDPPAFAPNRSALESGLRAYERVARLAAPLVSDGGYLTLCSCSHAADVPKFTGACLRGIGRAGRRAQLIYTGFAGPDHPRLPQLAESGYLKTLVFRL